MAELLPPTQRAALEGIFSECGIGGPRSRSSRRGEADAPRYDEDALIVEVDDRTLKIGSLTVPRKKARRPEMIPSPLFFDIPSHVGSMKNLLTEWKNGERAFLLLGNQGETDRERFGLYICSCY